MNDKFTLRDFFAYFLSGVALLIFSFINYYKLVIPILVAQKDVLKDYSALLIFISIPSAYFLGQILHGLDSIFYFVSDASRKIKIKIKRWYNPIFLLVYALNAHRISGRLYLKQNNSELFWQDCAKLQVEKAFSACEYWYVMNDLFKGLLLGAIIFLGISTATKSWLLVCVYAMLTIIFWFRAVYFANSFVDTVRRTKVCFIKNENQ